jgi:hypothetical protein
MIRVLIAEDQAGSAGPRERRRSLAPRERRFSAMRAFERLVPCEAFEASHRLVTR